MNDPIWWWIVAVEIPILTALIWLQWRSCRQRDADLEAHSERINRAEANWREALEAYKRETSPNQSEKS